MENRQCVDLDYGDLQERYHNFLFIWLHNTSHKDIKPKRRYKGSKENKWPWFWILDGCCGLITNRYYCNERLELHGNVTQ